VITSVGPEGGWTAQTLKRHCQTPTIMPESCYYQSQRVAYRGNVTLTSCVAMPAVDEDRDAAEEFRRNGRGRSVCQKGTTVGEARQVLK